MNVGELVKLVLRAVAPAGAFTEQFTQTNGSYYDAAIQSAVARIGGREGLARALANGDANARRLVARMAAHKQVKDREGSIANFDNNVPSTTSTATQATLRGLRNLANGLIRPGQVSL